MDLFRRTKQRRPVLLAVFSDTHINSTVALSPLVLERDDGDTWHASKVQQWIHECWHDFWGKIDQIAKQNSADLWAVSVGDLVESEHHGTFQLITKNPAAQKRMTIDLLEPIVKRAAYTFFVRGTPAHVGNQAWMEDEIASDLHDREAGQGGEIIQDGNRWSFWTLRLEAEGVYFVFNHHRRQNHLPWTMGGAANRLAAQTIYKYANAGHRIPDVIVRAHGHKFDESSGCHRTKVVFTPAWKSACEFVHRIEPDAIADIGGLWFLCDKGEYQWDKIMYPPGEELPWLPQQ